MPAPPLRIPVALDLDSLRQQTQQAASHVGEAVKAMGKAFTKVNGEVVGVAAASAGGAGLAWSQSLTTQALGFAKLAVGAVAAYKIIGGAISEAREQLAEMVSIADKSRDAGVGAEFLQKFLLVAKNLKVEAKDLDGALTKAFDTLKDKSPIDVGKWEAADENINAVELALRVYNQEVQKATGKRLEGLVLFRDAADQEAKVRAVLAAMIQLNEAGKKLESLDLGEKAFGQTIVDRIRQGRTSAEELLKTLQDTSSTSDRIFSNDLVKRAKDIDDELKKAHNTLSQNLKPAWDGLAVVALDIKNLWVQIVKLIGDASGVLNFFSASSELKRLKGDLEDVNKALENKTALFGLPALSGTERILTARKAELEALIAAQEKPPLAITVNPSRGVGAAPTEKGGSTGRDRFESSADSIEKRTAALIAENENINKGTEARERAKIAAELETVAKQINTEAGINNGKVTEEQRARIDAVAAAYGRAALAIEQARSPLATFARESADVGRALNQFAAHSLDGFTNALADVVTGTKSAKDAFKSLADAIIRDLARIAIRQGITGPIASALGGLFPVGGGAGVAPPLIFGPGYDAGGFTGSGARNQPAGIVHRGEYVFDQDAVNRIGVANLRRLQKGYADGGYVGQPSANGWGGGVVNNFEVITPPGMTATKQESRNDTGGLDMRVILEHVSEQASNKAYNRVVGDMAKGGTAISRATGSRFALNEASGNRGR